MIRCTHAGVNDVNQCQPTRPQQHARHVKGAGKHEEGGHRTHPREVHVAAVPRAVKLVALAAEQRCHKRVVKWTGVARGVWGRGWAGHAHVHVTARIAWQVGRSRRCTPRTNVGVHHCAVGGEHGGFVLVNLPFVVRDGGSTVQAGLRDTAGRSPGRR